MKYNPLSLSATILLTAGAYLVATTASASHPVDNGAVVLDTLTVSAEMNLSTQPTAHGDAVLWLTSDSTLDIILNLESINFTGTCTDLDSLQLDEICDLIAHSALDAALSSSYASFALNENVRVISHGWAERLGSDVSTSFQVCNLFTFATRKYSCSYAQPTWTWSLVSSAIDQCSTCPQYCESTLEEEVIE